LSSLPSRPFPEKSPDVSAYLGWPEIFRSWFWRFYDHLFKVLLFNLCWACILAAVAWAFFHFNLIGTPDRYDFYARVYILFLIECVLSVGWAHLIFKIFNEGDAAFRDFWAGFRKYLPKALGVSAISGLVIGLGAINILFYFRLHSSNRLLDFIPAAFVAWILLAWLSSCLYQWPLLFFQNPPFWRMIYRSFLLALGNSLVSMGVLVFFGTCFIFFSAVLFLWFFVGLAFFFSFQCVVLEKLFLRYKIIYEDKPLEPFLEILEREKQRGWKDFLRPWEN
jgi:hypothetical protein